MSPVDPGHPDATADHSDDSETRHKSEAAHLGSIDVGEACPGHVDVDEVCPGHVDVGKDTQSVFGSVSGGTTFSNTVEDVETAMDTSEAPLRGGNDDEDATQPTQHPRADAAKNSVNSPGHERGKEPAVYFLGKFELAPHCVAPRSAVRHDHELRDHPQDQPCTAACRETVQS